MLSSELAELAGVTVRTVRHYHQIGLLPEPPRSAGGHRRYDVSHLVRLLRITRLTALGVPLHVVPAVLDDAAAAAELLEELDQQAAADIDRLTSRRASIAALRHSGAPPDLPPELSEWRTTPGAGLPVDMARYEHAQLILLGHLLGKDGSSRLTALFGDTEYLAASAPLTVRFYALQPDTPEEEIASLIDDLVAHLTSVVARMTGASSLDPRVAALLDELDAQSLRPTQHRVLRQVKQRLVRPGGQA
ncbi:helix-turn-helix domain-containing protein [Jiangella endophytica]|uniref:helix-turn-helix domain-containing protein n=1 Tax=Jiangella endophytica TaxID=1623398 RepID=UPI000E3420D2|nr:MerR family transcriptional regulator [Jiangella endophytica]